MACFQSRHLNDGGRKLDMGRAVEASQVTHMKSCRRWFQFLRRRAKWTQDAIDLPHVWAIGDEQCDNPGTESTTRWKRFWGQ